MQRCVTVGFDSDHWMALFDVDNLALSKIEVEVWMHDAIATSVYGKVNAKTLCYIPEVPLGMAPG